MRRRSPRVTGWCWRRWRASGRGGQRRAAGRRAVGGATAGVVEQGGAGLRRAAAQGARARRRSRRRRTATGLASPADEVDAHRFERLVRRGRELLTLGEPERAAYVHRRGVGAVARAGAASSWRTGSRAGSRPAGSTSCAWTPRRSGSTRPCGPAGTARCSARPRPGWPRRRCGSGAGRCWRWPSTRPAARARRCAPAPGPHACWPPSWAWTRARTWSRWSRRSCARTRRWWPTAAPARAERDVPVPGSGALRRRRRRRLLRARRRGRRPACAGWPRSACSPWSGRRAAASRRWCAPGSPPRCSATAAGSWCHPGRPPDGRAHRAAGVGSGAGARGRPVRGGGHAVRRHRRAGRGSSPPWSPTPNAARWWWRCAPTGSATCRPTPASPASSSGACTCSARWSEADLRAAIEGPAHQAGLLLEPGLVDLLVREVEGEPGALPLLSHALRQTWQRREGRTLTVAGYQETGGIRGAVAQSAEEVYDRVPAEQRPLLRDLLLRLVAADPGRRAGAQPGAAPHGRHRRRPRAAHRAARRRPPRDQRRRRRRAGPRGPRPGLAPAAGLARRRRRGPADPAPPRVAADAWDAMGRPESELYRGVRLAQALDWRERGPTPTSRRPSRRSSTPARERADAEAATTEERAASRPASTAGCGPCSPASQCCSSSPSSPGCSPGARRTGPTAPAAVADARRVGAQALVVEDIDQSLLLAVEGVRLDDSTDTRANLLAALSRSPELIGSTRGDGSGFISLELSPDRAGRRSRSGI